MRLYSFEKLDVWQKARKLTVHIQLVTKQFPAEEKFGLTSQIRRAVVSVSSNLAEGSSRNSGKEQARYTEIAYGSLLEVLNQLILTCDLGYLSMTTLDKLRPKIEEIGNKLNSLKQYQINKSGKLKIGKTNIQIGIQMIEKQKCICKWFNTLWVLQMKMKSIKTKKI